MVPTPGSRPSQSLMPGNPWVSSASTEPRMPSMSSRLVGAAKNRGTPMSRNSTATIARAAQPRDSRARSRSRRNSGQVE